MAENDEIGAMQKIVHALEPLDDEAKKRALQWVISRFSVNMMSSSGTNSTALVRLNSASEDDGNTFAEIFEAANPLTEKEKALVAAYWTQVCENQTNFASQTLNSDLKDLGHGIGNITEALSQLKSERPALILQLKKAGTSRQARKTYKLTQEGIKRVQAMMQGRSTLNEQNN